VIELGYYCATIMFVSTVSSYAGKKIGISVSSVICGLSILFALGIGTMPVGGYDKILAVCFILIPSLAWFGFWLGRYFRKRQAA
jgi:hypothetical protein